jgi:hypothetical protein
LGWTEEYDLEPKRHLPVFIRSILAIGERRENAGSTLRLGVKFLLTSHNSKRLVSLIDNVLELHTGSGQPIVSHIKIKSIRGDGGIEPTIEQVRDFEHAMVSLKSRLRNLASDLQVDVRSARVHGAYKCWISPLMTVIDPSGSVHLCCNFYEDPDTSRIGELGARGEHKLTSFWGGARHRAVIQDMQPERVCNSTSGCHCRLVHYQQLVEPYLPHGDRNPVGNISLFPGHESML